MLKKANLDEYDSADDLIDLVGKFNLSPKQFKQFMYYLQEMADEIYQNAFDEGQENG